MAFGAGYAQAEDRLFLMDVLRHYGEGTLASFLGASCEFEQMDHDQLLLSPYTKAQAIAQVDALPAEYGAQGPLAKSLIDSYVDGVNRYIDAATTDPQLLPADYAAAAPQALPQKWTVADVVAIAGLIGGIFGKGGGIEVQNAHLLQYLRKELGTARRRGRVPAVPHVQRPARADDGRQGLPVREARHRRPGDDGAARRRRRHHRRTRGHRPELRSHRAEPGRAGRSSRAWPRCRST